MFENLKKKLKGFFGKASEQIEPPSPEKELKDIEDAEKQILSEVEKDLQSIPTPPPQPEVTTEVQEVKLPDSAKEKMSEVLESIAEKNEEKIPTAEEKVEELIAEPAHPAESDIEIITVEAEKKEEKIPTAEEKVEELIAEPKLPLPEDIEIVTVEPEKEEEKEEIDEAEEIEEKVVLPPPPPEHKPKAVVRELKAEIEEVEEKPGIFKLLSKLTHKELKEKDLTPVLWDLEVALLENDVAKEVTEKLISEVKQSLLSKKAKRGSVEEIIKSTLKHAVNSILSPSLIDINNLIAEKKEKPFVILFLGFNGTGKTLTIGKFAKILQDNDFSVVMAAGDTFRAAAIEQLEIHAKNLEVPIIKQQKGADSAAVIFDAIKHAKSKGIDVVLADTAGRSHTNANLMDELKKIVRVSKPDLKIFVGDSLTGNDAAEQARLFNEAVGIDASVLTKIDTDPKGGACLSVAYVTQKPILYLGTGQKYEDVIPFTAKWFVEKVF